MELRKLQRVVVDALEDIKAQDIQVFDTTKLTSLFDRVIIASATSNRQSRAIASNVRDKAKAAGSDVIAVEGEETGEWVLVDLGDIIIHIMQPAIRQYYNLEEIWGGKTVRVRLGAPDLPLIPKTTAKTSAKTTAKTTPKTNAEPTIKAPRKRVVKPKTAAAPDAPAADSAP
jgi:ribosome-associated protein